MGPAPAVCAIPDSSSATRRFGSPITAGTPRLNIPAFSAAMSSSVAPRYSTWSIPILVTPATSGVITLVASRRPPSPVSITATSTAAVLKKSNAIAVVASKNVAPSRSTSGVQRPTNSTICSGATGAPSTRNRSRKSTRCGDVYLPTFSPCARSTASIPAQTLPFPLVPATCSVTRSWCGSPSSVRKALTRSRPSFQAPVVRA